MILLAMPLNLVSHGSFARNIYPVLILVETSNVEPYEVTIGYTTLVLVDTPGFDDTNMSDFEILQSIAMWLEATYEKGQLLSGIVYLHRITNTRVAGSARRALHLFQRICGEDNYKNVILATTFWNCIAHCEEIGVDREQQLLSNEGFWKCMKEKGAQTTRLARDYKTMLPALIEMAAKPKVTLGIQHELNEGCSLERTMAGLFIKDNVAHLETEHERKTTQMQEDFNKRLQEQQGRRDAARRLAGQTALTNLANKEKSDLTVLERDRQAMQQKIEAFRLNQRVKEAELAAKLREHEALEAERVRVREHEEAQARRKAAERESEQRCTLSLTQRRQVDYQLQLLRAASLAGISTVSVPGVEAEGLGMVADGDPQRLTVIRTGLNEWCDFCLEPFGIGQRVCGCPSFDSSKAGLTFLTTGWKLTPAIIRLFILRVWTLYTLLCLGSEMPQSRPHAITQRPLWTRDAPVSPLTRLRGCRLRQSTVQKACRRALLSFVGPCSFEKMLERPCTNLCIKQTAAYVTRMILTSA